MRKVKPKVKQREKDDATMTGESTARGWCLILALFLLLPAGCATTQSVLELHGTIMYEKPVIKTISYTFLDRREEGGKAKVEVTMDGDPGLSATFDISPGIADRKPMKEISDGHYVGEFSFPQDLAGGPYTVIGRLHHDAAGDVILQDPDPLTVPLFTP
jgi:hypothetical protein